MGFWEPCTGLNGKGGPSLLVPSGLLISFRFRMSCVLFVTDFDFRLCDHEARDRTPFLSFLWWIPTLLLNTKCLGFTRSFETKFFTSWENPVLAREFFNSSHLMEWFVDSFRGHVHKVFVIVPTNFQLLWTWFDHPIVKFFQRSRAEKPVLLRQDFSLSLVEPTLAFFYVGSTGEWINHVLGFSSGCTDAFFLLCIGSTSDTEPVPLWLLFDSLHRRIEISEHRFNRCSLWFALQSLWTTAPVFEFLLRRFNRCFESQFCGPSG